MNSELKAFVDAERKRVVEPDPHFAMRVMARLQQVRPGVLSARPASIWDIVPGAANPVFALAALLLLAFLVIQSVVPPAIPRSAAVTEDILYVGTDGVAADEAFAELIVPEGGL